MGQKSAEITNSNVRKHKEKHKTKKQKMPITSHPQHKQ